MAISKRSASRCANLTKILFLTLTIVFSGFSAINNFSVSKPKSVLAMTKNNTIAQVLKVAVTGQSNNYTFAVTLSSPDTGCNRYADWWEVITPQGELLYRRVLLHSHVDEQPFTRTGGTVAIEPQQEVIVRVHMSADGYSPMAQKGTVESGFAAVTLPSEFAVNLESVEPLPGNCAF
ncbi:conserved hypothetical protein [Hyella patelloides LEGE 07179]|uniref:Uncharacterized protein n=2 Tax=Hyella TaxID=945733 RepID=A0A563VLA4_9CYAN|nr:conserved hypothetical protein [Hyella patelloides LEGE 07179]